MNVHGFAELIRLEIATHPVVGKQFVNEYVTATGTAGVTVNFVHMACVFVECKRRRVLCCRARIILLGCDDITVYLWSENDYLLAQHTWRNDTENGCKWCCGLIASLLDKAQPASVAQIMKEHIVSVCAAPNSPWASVFKRDLIKVRTQSTIAFKCGKAFWRIRPAFPAEVLRAEVRGDGTVGLAQLVRCDGTVLDADTCMGTREWVLDHWFLGLMEMWFGGTTPVVSTARVI